MKLVSFRYANGAPSYGAISSDGAGVIDWGARFGELFPTLRSFISLERTRMNELLKPLVGAKPDVSLADVKLLPVITNPDKIICVGVNYVEHREETGRKPSEYPTLFARFANSIVGHEQPLVRPRASDKYDYEGELAVVIGEAGRHISEQNALAHVAGYSCFNDGTLRDWQSHTSQFTPGKNFCSSGAFGPWLVTSDELADPTNLTVTTRLNGAEMQRDNTSNLIFSTPQLIAYISTFTRLEPGDVISTGTPGGVGFKRNPPVFLKAGDTVEVEITNVGVLRNMVVEE